MADFPAFTAIMDVVTYAQSGRVAGGVLRIKTELEQIFHAGVPPLTSPDDRGGYGIESGGDTGDAGDADAAARRQKRRRISSRCGCAAAG